MYVIMKSRMIKQAVCLAFALAALLPLQAFADDAPALVVWNADGSKANYALEESPKVTFTETALVVTLHGKATSYPLESLSRVTYENVQGTGISDLWNCAPSFSVQGNLLVFSALKADSDIAVYTLDGQLLHKERIVTAGRYAFPLSDITDGVYMVSVNGVTYKFLKR